MNQTRKSIIFHIVLASVALFLNGFGIHLTIRAGIGAHPWDVFNLGLHNTLGILFGTASIAVGFTILLIDVFMKEPVGIAMFIDAIVVGKAVDFFDYLDVIPYPQTMPGSILLMLVGLFIMGYTQYFYMVAALGCGPRDTLLVGLKKRLVKVPIGVISIILLATVTVIGYLLGGPVGIGTLICAFGAGPIMQFAFFTMHFDAAGIKHQNLKESWEVLRPMRRRQNECH